MQNSINDENKFYVLGENDEKFCKDQNSSTSQKPSCCSSQKACALGSFDSIFQAMKESHVKPHRNGPLEYSIYRNESESRNLVEKKNLLKEALSELSLKNTSNNFENNKQPFIPMCKIFGYWGKLSFSFYQFNYTAWCEAFLPGSILNMLLQFECFFFKFCYSFYR